MLDGQLHLRTERRPRHAHWWRLPLLAGFLSFAIGGACLEPLAPTVLAPLASPAEMPKVAVEAPAQALPVLVAPAAGVKAQPLAAPTLVTLPVPAVLPTLSSAGQALLDGIKGDLSARWLKNHAETALRSGPNETSQLFTMLPQWSTLRVLQAQPDWLFVQYGGDGATRQPGPGWVKAADVGAVGPPTVWLRTSRASALWGGSDASASRALDVPPSALMEVIGPDQVQGTRVHVRLPGDGRQVPPSQGWIDGDSLARSASPGFTLLPRAYPAILAADVRLRVPYRSQLDGSDYESANCGPTTLGMALEAFGVNVPPNDLRFDVLNSEEFNTNDNDAGSFIWALARVAQARGLRTFGLYESDSETLHHWSVDEVRANVRAGRPVIVQVVYRGLPGREDSGYDGDHYVVITGLMGDNFIYNDPIGGAEAREAPGWDRLMTSDQLQRAMRASDRAYAYTAFGLARANY
jgi:Peptidase_C39 like family